MIEVRRWVLGLGLGLLLTAVTWADEPKRANPPMPPDPAAMRVLAMPLLPQAAREKLKLTDEQKEKVDKIVEEYEEKRKEGLSKLKGSGGFEATQKLFESLKKQREA